MKKREEPELRELADYVYENIFRYYTQKQWDVAPDALDPAAMARVPVLVSEDCGYFQDPWQGMPAQGYTALFTRMLDHPAIRVELGGGLRANASALWQAGCCWMGSPAGSR